MQNYTYLPTGIGNWVIEPNCQCPNPLNDCIRMRKYRLPVLCVHRKLGTNFAYYLANPAGIFGIADNHLLMACILVVILLQLLSLCVAIYALVKRNRAKEQAQNCGAAKAENVVANANVEDVNAEEGSNEWSADIAEGADVVACRTVFYFPLHTAYSRPVIGHRIGWLVWAVMSP